MFSQSIVKALEWNVQELLRKKLDVEEKTQTQRRVSSKSTKKHQEDKSKPSAKRQKCLTVFED